MKNIKGMFRAGFRVGGHGGLSIWRLSLKIMKNDDYAKVINICRLVFFCSNVNRQENIITEVLKKNRVDKEFYFNSYTKEDGLNEIYLKYLGLVKTDTGGRYKILTWKRVWGPNKHTTGIVFIYDLKNKFVGKYHLGSGFDLPDMIRRNTLIFTNKSKTNCDTNLITNINFDEGLPKEIFLKCKGEYGDIYILSKGE